MLASGQGAVDQDRVPLACAAARCPLKLAASVQAATAAAAAAAARLTSVFVVCVGGAGAAGCVAVRRWVDRGAGHDCCDHQHHDDHQQLGLVLVLWLWLLLPLQPHCIPAWVAAAAVPQCA